MKTILRIIALVSSFTAFSFVVRAENWPNWRGPSFNGSTPAENLPVRFSPSENVRWAAEMPGPSAGTPIVWGDRIFVSSTDERQKALLAMCLDRRTGKVLWQHQVGPGFSQDDRSNYASPSPVTDGKLVVFFYGNGELVAFDMEGEKLWGRNLQNDYGQFAFLWTFSTSPQLYDGRLYMQVLQRDVAVSGRGRRDGPNDSYLLALDPKTGKELWKHLRPSEARAESREAFTTPIPHTHQGRDELLVAGGDDLSGHDPDTGRELWRWGTWNPSRIGHWRLVPSPVAGGDVILACAPKHSPVYAIKAGAKGKLDDSAIAWKGEDRAVSSDVSTPLFYKGRFYILNSDRKTLACVEPSGKVIWTGETGSRSKFEASPTGADDKIYVMNFRGEVYVFGTGDEFKMLAVNPMAEGEDKLRSSVAVSQGDLFIRTDRKLYCVSNSKTLSAVNPQ